MVIFGNDQNALGSHLSGGPSWLGWTSQLGSVQPTQTRSSPPPLLTLALPHALATRGRRHRCHFIPADSGRLRRRHGARSTRLTTAHRAVRVDLTDSPPSAHPRPSRVPRVSASAAAARRRCRGPSWCSSGHEVLRWGTVVVAVAWLGRAWRRRVPCLLYTSPSPRDRG